MEQLTKIGPYEVSAVVATRFRLDGGAMFGSVPKTLWERRSAPDAQNRIRLACRVLILRSAERTILVDVGCGTKWSPKEEEIYQFEWSEPKELHERVHGVTDVIITHMHFDHGGGVSYRAQDGSLAPSFPDATHYLQAANYEVAKHPGPRERATYLADNVQPLAETKLVLTHSGQEVLPGITVVESNGHTRGLQWVLIQDAHRTLALPSELIPTTHHISLPYVMGYDLHAEQTLIDKEDFIQKALAGNWTVFFGHDPEIAAATLATDAQGRYCVGSEVAIPPHS
ncbi:MAG: MBL fold metallo-hydrolase [Bdellovibrionales bacterium]|nr:MBL fold metallo-hydrolase [Bdellovibrionales bacterium]